MCRPETMVVARQGLWVGWVAEAEFQAVELALLLEALLPAVVAEMADSAYPASCSEPVCF